MQPSQNGPQWTPTTIHATHTHNRYNLNDFTFQYVATLLRRQAHIQENPPRSCSINIFPSSLVSDLSTWFETALDQTKKIHKTTKNKRLAICRACRVFIYYYIVHSIARQRRMCRPNLLHFCSNLYVTHTHKIRYHVYIIYILFAQHRDETHMR